ncbi:winged helix-turn-helix domain-containing protein [Streptomyces sp. T-3]|nr:winged helix-turn-helix domain-containing protein [Streptomyces sp. T-3]
MNEVRAGDGGGKEFQRVSDVLHARLSDGTYPMGHRLPSQRELAQELGVSRDTIQRVFAELINERWIESRQGSGSRVVRAQEIHSSSEQLSRGPTTLGPLISAAFESPQVSLDVFTLTSESLDAHIRVQAERVRAGLITPERIDVRMLLPSEEMELPYPRVKDDLYDTRLRNRFQGITSRFTQSLRSVLWELDSAGLVGTTLRIRRIPLTPTGKLYLLNGREALFGPYEIVERRLLLDSGEEVDALDVQGLGTTLTHFVKDDDPHSQGSAFVTSMQAWFDSCWNLLAEERD